VGGKRENPLTIGKQGNTPPSTVRRVHGTTPGKAKLKDILQEWKRTKEGNVCGDLEVICLMRLDLFQGVRTGMSHLWGFQLNKKAVLAGIGKKGSAREKRTVIAGEKSMQIAGKKLRAASEGKGLGERETLALLSGQPGTDSAEKKVPSNEFIVGKEKPVWGQSDRGCRT